MSSEKIFDIFYKLARKLARQRPQKLYSLSTERLILEKSIF